MDTLPVAPAVRTRRGLVCRPFGYARAARQSKCLRGDHDCHLLYRPTAGLQPAGDHQWLDRDIPAPALVEGRCLQPALLLCRARAVALVTGGVLVGTPLQIWPGATGDPRCLRACPGIGCECGWL